MTVYLQIHSTGAIVGMATSPQIDADWIVYDGPMPADISLFTYDPDAGLALRPALPAPHATPTGITWAGLPEGTWVYVTDATEDVPLGTLRVTGDGAATFDLPESGEYLFDLAPPLPHLSLLWRVSVP